MTRRIPLLAATASFLLVSLAVAPGASAEDVTADAAREVFKKHQNAVVWVSAVIKTRGGGALAAIMGQQEQKVEAVGTIIHESGLVVCSHTNIDPTGYMNQMVGDMKIDGVDGKMEFKSELSGMKIRLADGTELPAKLVLTDEDLDLAFILPTDTKKKQVPFVNLQGGDAGAGAAKETAVMDPLVVLGRLDQTLDRQPAVYPARVNAVVKKPRTFYVCSDLQALGVPAFAADGRPLGIAVMRKQNLGRGAAGMLGSMTSSGGMAVVIIPGQDVMEVAEQALTKKDETKAATREDAKARPAAGTANDEAEPDRDAEPAEDPAKPAPRQSK
jgi:hypothetical protein